MTGPIHDDGGWISGPMLEPADRRPEFNPAFLAAEVIRLLAEHGIGVDPGPSEMHVAALAAADLLRALGVRPATAPQRP